MHIRSYRETDLESIEERNTYLGLLIKHHGGVKPHNIVCAVAGEKIMAVGLLNEHRTLSGGVTKVILSIFPLTDEVEASAWDELLTDPLIERFCELSASIRSMVPPKLCVHCEADELAKMQRLLQRGFAVTQVFPILKYDLYQDTVHYSIPDGIDIRPYVFDEAGIAKYLLADAQSSDDAESVDDTRFRRGDQSFACYAAMDGDEIAGVISVWDISEERAATENIFVLPAYRRRSIAKELIATAFDVLKQRSKTMATLSVHGTNTAAMRLYQSCGYRLYYLMLEMAYTAPM